MRLAGCGSAETGDGGTDWRRDSGVGLHGTNQSLVIPSHYSDPFVRSPQSDPPLPTGLPRRASGWSDEGLKGEKNARRERLRFTAGDTAAPFNGSSLERFGAH